MDEDEAGRFTFSDELGAPGGEWRCPPSAPWVELGGLALET